MSKNGISKNISKGEGIDLWGVVVIVLYCAFLKLLGYCQSLKINKLQAKLSIKETINFIDLYRNFIDC